MSQNNNEDVFKEKRKPKGEINFHMSLNEEQKVAKQIILDNPVISILLVVFQVVPPTYVNGAEDPDGP